jgi:hypothetical protein
MSEEKESSMQCSDFYDIADSYLGDELLVETNHEVLQHVEACAACRRELAARRELRSRLRAAFNGAAKPGATPEFAGRLRAELRAKALGQSQSRNLFFERIGRNGVWTAAVAASLVVVVGLFALQQRQSSTPPSTAGVAATGEHAHTRATENAGGRGEAWPQHQASPHVRKAGLELSEAAAGDHRDCAIKFRLAEDPIDLEEAGHKYDRAYINLASVVKTRSEDATGQFEFLESHSCVFKGRRFAHLVIKHRGRVVSLLVAERGQEEQAAGATGSGQVAPSDEARRQVNACSRSGEFQVSCFETARHAIFVVSDLSEAENLAVARTFAPSIREHIARGENAA